MSAYVEIPRPYESTPGRFTVDLVFPAASKRRAKRHHDVAWTLADVHGVEAATPFALNPRWSYYKEICGTDERYGGLEDRRLTVQGSARALARYLAALTRVLDAVEGLATRAVRAFGAWKRSVAAEPHLEYEDASTMRVRSREFRADALSALVRGLRGTLSDAPERDSSRPLWEQYGTVAAEVWAHVGGVDLTEAPEEDVAAHLARMLPEEPEQGELFAVQDVTVHCAGPDVERPRDGPARARCPPPGGRTAGGPGAVRHRSLIGPGFGSSPRVSNGAARRLAGAYCACFCGALHAGVSLLYCLPCWRRAPPTSRRKEHRR